MPLREAAPGLPNRRDVVAVTWRRPGKYLETDGSPQHISRLGKVHRATATWAEHHLLWIDRRLPVAIAGKICAMDRNRPPIRAVRHQRHHHRPEMMFQAGMKAQHVGRRQVDAARGKIGL